jgi:hypothetical protein
MADVFDEATPSDSFLDKYVGEGKKYATAEELAKAYENADKFIPELKNDLQTTREFIATKLEELAKQRSEAITPPVQTGDDGGNNPPLVQTPNDSGEDLDTRIKKALEEEREVSKLQDNAAFAEKTLIEQLGSKEAAIKAVADKAIELGVDAGYLRDTALRSPTAFFNLMGVKPGERPTSTSTPAPAADVNTATLGHGQPKPNTYQYYEQMRKSNEKLYWNPKTQAALMKDALENPNFFKR